MLPCCHVDFWRPRLPWASLCTVENSSSGPIAGGLQHWMGPLLGRLRMQLNHPALGMCNTSNIPRNHLNRFVSRLHEASPAKTLYSSLPVDALDTECLKRNCAKDLTHDSGRGNDSETVPKKVKLHHNSSWWIFVDSRWWFQYVSIWAISTSSNHMDVEVSTETQLYMVNFPLACWNYQGVVNLYYALLARDDKRI